MTNDFYERIKEQNREKNIERIKKQNIEKIRSQNLKRCGRRRWNLD